MNREQICEFFLHTRHHNLETNDVSGCPLCIIHYGQLYRKLHPVSKNCKTCNKVITAHTKYRKCPDPTLIGRFLQQNKGFTVKIHVEDHVCYACYKAHLVIIKLTNNTTYSSDQDLFALIQQLKAELKNEGAVRKYTGAGCLTCSS